jgi:hypothetical protein
VRGLGDPLFVLDGPTLSLGDPLFLLEGQHPLTEPRRVAVPRERVPQPERHGQRPKWKGSQQAAQDQPVALGTIGFIGEMEGRKDGACRENDVAQDQKRS